MSKTKPHTLQIINYFTILIKNCVYFEWMRNIMTLFLVDCLTYSINNNNIIFLKYGDIYYNLNTQEL